jgi:transcription initiation factor TFIID subunit TAF12
MVGRRERFQDVRDDLWRLMQELDLTELFRDLIDGRDDYGTLLYDYKVFGRL